MQRFHLSPASWKGAVPILLFLVFVVALVVLVVLTGRDPIVSDVTPDVVADGDRLTITGRHFGEIRGTIRLAGAVLPSSSVFEWSEDQIVITVPQGADSGLLFVETDSGSSAGDLIRMQSSVPRSSAASYTPGSPQIQMLETTETRIGDILIIAGHNFGTQRRDSQVLFSSPTDDGYSSPEPASVSYPAWTDTQIHVRVPSSAQSGLVYVHTVWGASNPMRLLIDRPAGQLSRTDRSEISVRYGADVTDVRIAEEAPDVPGSTDVLVWLPRIPTDLGQSDVRYLDSEVAANAMAVRDGIDAVRFEDVDETFAASALRTVVANRFGLQLEIDASRVSPVYEAESGFFEHFTDSTPMIPADHESLAPIAARVRQGRASPYQIARATYDWILGHLDYALYAESRDAIAGFNQAFGDDFTYATLFVAVLRAARIPSRIVGGVLVSGQGQVYPHFWAEYFIPAMGWIPVDPALGDGAFPAGFPEPEDSAEFYFGNLDSHRLAFHHGYAANGPDLRDGLHFAPDDPFTGQHRYAEAGPAISDLRIQWLAPRSLAVRVW